MDESERLERMNQNYYDEQRDFIAEFNKKKDK